MVVGLGVVLVIRGEAGGGATADEAEIEEECEIVCAREAGWLLGVGGPEELGLAGSVIHMR